MAKNLLNESRKSLKESTKNSLNPLKNSKSQLKKVCNFFAAALTTCGPASRDNRRINLTPESLRLAEFVFSLEEKIGSGKLAFPSVWFLSCYFSRVIEIDGLKPF